MKRLHREIALFVAIVPAFAVWLPLLLYLFMGIVDGKLGFTLLIYWLFPGFWVMRLFGFTDHDLTSGGDFMRLPSNFAFIGVLTVYTVMGLIVWASTISIRNILRNSAENFPMTMKTLLNLTAIFVASLAQLIPGTFVVSSNRILIRMISDTDTELSLISKASVAYNATAAPIVVGIALFLASLLGLLWVYRSERMRWLLPFLLCISFVVVILHMMFVSFGITYPFVHMMKLMEQ